MNHPSKLAVKMIGKKIFVMMSSLKWAWDFLLLPSFYSSEAVEVVRVVESASYSLSADHECAVCLCRMEEGEEIRELKCSHIFHRVCFERWGGYGRWTCPLCRNHINFDEMMNVLVFNFSQITTTNNHTHTWWLR